MPTTTSRFIWGFQINPSGSTQNNKIDFNRGGVKVATLNAGVYSPDDFATEVGRALEAADAAAVGTWACSFSHSTFKFTISVGEAFTLLWGTGANVAVDASDLLGFDAVDQASVANAAASDSAVPAPPQTTKPSMWLMVDPNAAYTPVVAAAAGAAMTRGQRRVRAVQHVADGGLAETVFFSSDRLVEVEFRALSGADLTSMDSFLDWIERGRRFIWYPDSTATTFAELILADPGQLMPEFEWLTRSEVSWGSLLFLEQTSRT